MVRVSCLAFDSEPEPEPGNNYGDTYRFYRDQFARSLFYLYADNE